MTIAHRTALALSLVISISSTTLMPMSMAAAPAKTTPAAATEVNPPPANVSYKTVEPLSLLQSPEQHIGEAVEFSATFVSFTPYALDYKPAMRSSKDYIAFLIQRPDATKHVIPLSELKLLLPRKKVDKVMDLENGDQINVKGRIYSAALGDPWVDVDDLTITQKSPANLAKAAKRKKKHPAASTTPNTPAPSTTPKK